MRCETRQTGKRASPVCVLGKRLRLPYAVKGLVLVGFFCLPPLLNSQEIKPQAEALYARALELSNATDRVPLLKQALNLSPHFVEARLELVKVLLDSGEVSEARTHVNTTLNYDRAHPFAWFQKGRTHALAGEDLAAQKSFQRAIKIKADEPEFYLGLGQLHHKTSDWDEASRMVDMALSSSIKTENREQQVEAWYWKGRIHVAQGDTINSLDSFEKALALGPNHTGARSYLNKIVEHLGLEESYRTAAAAIAGKNWGQAQAILQDLVARSPEFRDVREQLNLVRNEIESAQRLLETPPARPSQERSKLIPVTTEPSTETDLPTPGEVEIETEGPQTVAQGELSDSLSESSDRLPQPGSDLNTEPTSDWLMQLVIGGGAAVFLGLLGLLLYKRLAQSAQVGLATRSSSQYAETKTVVVPQDVLKTEFGRYRIEHELGHGGMGKVYKARDLKLERAVALKVIHLHGGIDKEEMGELITRFRREAKATARLNHPNIVSLYDYDEKNGVFYMTMEFVEGRSVQEMLDTKETLEFATVVKIVRETCQALAYAHRHDLVHRDIKPPNIMINTDGRVKILDFGIAKILNLTQTQSPTMVGTRLGSPLYMSPEQINAGILDGRSDIFALGVVFYEMLIAQRPFNINEGDNLNRLFYMILKTDPPAPSSLRNEIPPRLDAIVAKMLAKDRDKRYRTAGEIINALRFFS